MEESNSANPKRLRKFMRNVISAGKRIEDREAIEPETKGLFSNSLREMEQKMNRVVDEETKILALANEENAKTGLLAKELHNVQGRMSSLWQKDDEIINSLKEQIQELQENLAESRRNKEAISELKNNINCLKNKLESYVNAKSERERRIEELEEKISKEVNVNFNELIKVEEQLKNMEEKYHGMKLMDVSPIQLKRFKEKIDAFRERVFAKKKKMIEESSSSAQINLSSFPAPSPKPEIKKQLMLPAFPLPPSPIEFLEHPESNQKQIRHDLIFEAVSPKLSAPKDMPFPPKPGFNDMFLYPAKNIELFTDEKKPKKNILSAVKNFIAPKKKQQVV